MAKPLRVPLLIVKREYFDMFASGEKTIEYRRYGRMFNEGVFYSGRAIRISISYDIYKYPVMDAIVTYFEIKQSRDVHDLTHLYPHLQPDDRIALIHVKLVKGKRPPRRGGAVRGSELKAR